MKRCKDCKKIKSIDDFYNHKLMQDGRQSSCKECMRLKAKLNYHRNSLDPKFMEAERARHREKYKRLKYKDSQIDRNKKKPYNNNICKNLHKELNLKKGEEAHHWSYLKENLKDVFIIPINIHRKVHKKLIYVEHLFCFKDLNGNILDTKQKHKEFLTKNKFI